MPDTPVITTVREVRLEHGARIWQVYDAQETLLGWTVDIPARTIGTPAVFHPRTGHVVTVDWPPTAAVIPLS